MAGEIEIRKGEGKWIQFTVTRGGSALNLVSAQDYLFAIKADEDSDDYLFAKSGESFDTTQAALGLVRVNVSPSESNALGQGSFVSELRIVLISGEDEDKSTIIPFEVRPSIIHT